MIFAFQKFKVLVPANVLPKLALYWGCKISKKKYVTKIEIQRCIVGGTVLLGEISNLKVKFV